MDNKCFVHTCKSGFTVLASNDGCVAKPDGKTSRGFPVSGAGGIVDTATGLVHVVAREELSESVAPGNVVGDKAPRTDATSGLAHSILSGAKASLSGAQSNILAGVAKAGNHLARDVTDSEQR